MAIPAATLTFRELNIHLMGMWAKEPHTARASGDNSRSEPRTRAALSGRSNTVGQSGFGSRPMTCQPSLLQGDQVRQEAVARLDRMMGERPGGALPHDFHESAVPREQVGRGEDPEVESGGGPKDGAQVAGLANLGHDEDRILRSVGRRKVRGHLRDRRPYGRTPPAGGSFTGSAGSFIGRISRRVRAPGVRPGGRRRRPSPVNGRGRPVGFLGIRVERRQNRSPGKNQ